MLSDASELEFVWLELTNRCNLNCGHCYANSGPHAGENDTLTLADYDRVLLKARNSGCRAVQFIGGEPTLNRGLPHLIQSSRGLGYELVEVYTNLFSISESLWRVFLDNRVCLATSFYSADPAIFDQVTTRNGSFDRVVRNIEMAVARGLALRVGIVVFDHTRIELEQTMAFVRTLGVKEISVDHVREFGRAAPNEPNEMKNLCGKCAGNILVIGPDGTVAPCIMSKAWRVGNLHHQELDEILSGDALAETRRRIFDATQHSVRSPSHVTTCEPNDCAPYFNCAPMSQCSPCAPNGGNKCIPSHNCNPGQVSIRQSVML